MANAKFDESKFLAIPEETVGFRSTGRWKSLANLRRVEVCISFREIYRDRFHRSTLHIGNKSRVIRERHTGEECAPVPSSLSSRSLDFIYLLYRNRNPFDLVVSQTNTQLWWTRSLTEMSSLNVTKALIVSFFFSSFFVDLSWCTERNECMKVIRETLFFL